MRFTSILTGCVVFLALSLSTRAQIVQPGNSEPEPLLDKAQPLENIARVFAPAVDLAATAAEDDLRLQQGLPLRFAISNAVSIRPDTHGTWETIGDTMLWRQRITSPGALSINLGFTRYLMPAGGSLSIYSTDGNLTIRPFTDLDNATHGQLWAPIIPADDIVIEVKIPATARRTLGLELGSINVGYRKLGAVDAAQKDASTPASGSCNVDVVCPEGDGWRDQIQTVGVYTVNGSWTCTGAMVNNTAQDATPYFLTADHCGISSSNAASVTVYWNFQNSTCRLPGSAASGGSGDGSLSQFQTGAFFRADYSASDMTLIEMDSAPDPAWNVAFSGWDNTSADATSAVAIHHPNTDEKRISFEYDPTTTTTYLQNAIPGNGTHIRVTDWDLGTTEPGSSGSPLFNQDQRIIGQLHGGYASCSSQTSDWYGRVSVSWAGGGSNSTRLSNWLDPGSTGATEIDILSGGGLTIAPGGEVLHVGNVGGPFTNPSVTYTLGNPSSNSIDYSVSLTSSFGVLLDGGTSPITGTLASGGGTVDVVVTLGSAIDALAAGLYVEDIVFADLTNGTERTRQHSFEIGFTTFTVTPAGGLDTGGSVGGPFPGSILYTVTSDRPTPVSVEIQASDSWISLNGGTGPVTMNLNGTGTSDTVTVTISPDANALPSGIYNGAVTLTNLSGGTGDTARTVTLDVGRMFFPSTDTPLAVNDNATATSTINLPDNFCVGDVNIDLDLTHSYIGDLSINLTSPSGTIVRLHDRSGGSANDIVQTYDDEGISPDGPGTLGDFDFEAAAGDWTLTVTDNASGDTGTLNSWALRIALISGNCSTPVVAYSFPMDTDPSWSVEGQWAFGQPTGQGSGNGDPTGGYTGANVYGYNLSGDYPSDMSVADYLTTPAIDCTALSGTRLRFRRWLGVESASYDHANIEVSADGSNWTTVWDHTATSAINESAWSVASYNISAVADGASTVFIRWGMGPTDSLVTYAGWNIDDVEITGIIEETDCNNNGVPDSEDISLGTSADCNLNNLPDECDIASGSSPDSNVNGVPDECEPGACCLADGTCSVVTGLDCPTDTWTFNLACSPGLCAQPGSCCLAGEVCAVTLEADCPTGVWDGGSLCDPSPCPTAPTASAAGCRYLEITPDSSNPTNPVALHVVSPDYPCMSKYVTLSVGVSRLVDSPVFATPAEWGTVLVGDAAIIPSTTYRVEIENALGLSDPATAVTPVWGDAVGTYAGSTWTPPNGIVDFDDIGAVVDAFRQAPTAPELEQCDFAPAAPDQVVDFDDIGYCVDGFRGVAYPFALPPNCP